MTGNYTTDDSYIGSMIPNNTRRAYWSPETRPTRGSSRVRIPTGQSGTRSRRARRPARSLRSSRASSIRAAASTSSAQQRRRHGGQGHPTFGAAPAAASRSCCRAKVNHLRRQHQRRGPINPVQTVRWSLQATTAPLAPEPALGLPGNKFDLYREIVDASGASVPPPGGPQVVAEYGVDLKFGLSVDNPDVALPPPTNQMTLDMDNPADAIAIGQWTQAASTRRPAVPRRRSAYVRFVSARDARGAPRPRRAYGGAPGRRTSRVTAASGDTVHEVRSRADNHVGSRADQPGGDDLLMKPTSSLSRPRASISHRARARRQSEGAVMFIVAVTLGLLAAMGVYGLTATQADIKSAGHMREALQAQRAGEHALSWRRRPSTPQASSRSSSRCRGRSGRPAARRRCRTRPSRPGSAGSSVSQPERGRDEGHRQHRQHLDRGSGLLGR